MVRARYGLDGANSKTLEQIGREMGFTRERVRQELFPKKIGAERWLDLMRLTHEKGLKSNVTLLFGHIETREERIEHMMRVRELQDETNGFMAFIPLAFHPENTGLAHLPKPTGHMDLRMIALSRLMLDNFDHVKAYWIMLGEQIAQTALAFGADDIDGTVVHELIYHDAGATTPEIMSVDDIRRLISEAGREPVERDTVYNRIVRDSDDTTQWHVAEVAVT